MHMISISVPQLSSAIHNPLAQAEAGPHAFQGARRRERNNAVPVMSTPIFWAKLHRVVRSLSAAIERYSSQIAAF